MKKRFHRKKRNSALLYEFLIRHISKCLVEGKKEEANKAIDISKKYFSEGAPLRNELNLFNIVLKNTVKTKDSAQKILNSLYESSAKSNVRILDEAKSKLIKDINYTFKKPEIYDYKVPNYAIYASIQTLLNESRNKNKILDVVSKIKLEENVLEYLTRNESTTENVLKINPNYGNTVYKFLLNRFDKKYEGKLNEHQKRLLMKYATFLISNKQGVIKEFLEIETKRIKNSLTLIKDENIKKDLDLMKKINDCIKKFESFNIQEISDNKILELLQYQKLVEEIYS